MERTVRRSLSTSGSLSPSDGAFKVIEFTERLRVERLRTTICPNLTDRVRAAYEQHYEALYRYLLLTGSAPDEAQDVIQQGFIRFIQVLRDGDPVDQPKSWLMRVVHNLRIDRYRKQRREIDFENPQAIQAVDRLFAHEPDPEARLLTLERHRQVKESFRSLSPQQYQYLLLRLEGLKLREIAQIFGVSVQTVSESCAKAMLKFGKASDEE
jgi:RNA polymerase sigma factor (sigma-70 family)